MLFMILGHNKDDIAEVRAKARPAHLEHLKQLAAEGRLVLAGPRPKVEAQDPGAAGFYGSLIVAEFPDLAAARAWSDEDPYSKAGVFSRVDVQPFIKVLP